MTTFGYLLPAFEPDAPLLELGTRAEVLGFEAVWVPDSPFQYGVPDPLVVLAALAARTSTVALATGVLLAALRPPALLAQQLASLDALSGGRVRAGLGGGFRSPESAAQFAAAGVEFDTRVGRLVEAIALMRALWASPGAPVTFEGRHATVRDLTLSPAPAQPGGPPIWLAGAGKRAEARVGRLADGWLPYHRTPEGWARVRAAARGRHETPVPALYLTVALDDNPAVARERIAATVERWYGRPFALISQLQATYAGSPAGLAEHLAPYLEAGVEHVVMRIAGKPVAALEAAADAVWPPASRGTPRRDVARA
jgi:alkanesulfonate monooxygenase SsuD/methylene tetrahydromethanopterin reductase-like flavin-dependent oxidoreductase (luciferase family)